ncbi:glycosyltransferase family 4 protein [Myxococcota bacterium]|nr:glycosyltransferase family 4 protein [Myxococcota bacterium]
MSSCAVVRRDLVTLVTFGDVRPTHRGADGSTWELIEYLYAEGRLGQVICCDFESDAASRIDVPFVVPSRPIFHWGSVLIERLGAGKPAWVRRSRERLFDFLVSRSSALAKAERVLFRKPNFERTVRWLRRRGIPTLAIASILHPRTNFDRVGSEAKRRGLLDRSSYRDETRVRQIEKFFASCDRVLTTEEVGEVSFHEHGLPTSRIVTTRLMNGADCERFSPRVQPRSPGPLRYLHLSAMNLIKGVGPLFEAWSELALVDAELWLAGSMDASTQRLFERYGLSRERWLGPVEDSPEQYRQADVFISPSLSDSAPNTILEALASGLPVISSDACGASILIENGVNGWVYPWHDVQALGDCIRWFYDHRSRLSEMGAAARATALENRRGKLGEAVLKAIDSQPC